MELAGQVQAISWAGVGLIFIQPKQINSQMACSSQGQGMQFQLKVVSVKMKIKFPCRMALEHGKQLITREVSSTEGSKFLFNEDFTLKGQDGQTYELLAILYTDKGTRYTSGVMKLMGAELMRSQGQRLIIPLTKCLDPDAFCQLKVEQVGATPKSMLKISNSNSRIYMSPDKAEVQINDVRRINSEKFLIGETRSEVDTPMSPKLPISEEARVREGTKRQVFKTFTKSPPSKFSDFKYLTANYLGNNGNKIMSEFPAQEAASQRPIFAESEVIRESYNKLKQKYKKQSELAKQQTHKRMLLEANQNNSKLEIIKLKLRCETQEKQINSKNDKIKSIGHQLSELQKKDIDLAYLREQCSSLEAKVHMGEDTIANLTKENEAVKKMMAEKSKMKDQAISGMKHELEIALAKIGEQRHEIEMQGKTKDGIIQGKNNDLQMRTETILRQKKMIKQLEDQAENKLFQFQKSLTSERTSLQTKIDELKSNIISVDKEKQQLQDKCSVLSLQIQKHKSSFTSLQYSQKLLSEQIIDLNKDLSNLKVVKQKHIQLQKEHKFLQEQFETIRRNLQLSLQNKDVNIKDMMAKYEENKVRYQKWKAESDEKAKNSILKTQELQILNEKNRNVLQKNVRSNESMTKQLTNLKKVNYTLREQMKKAERRIITLQGEHSSHYSKYERQTANFTFLLQKYKEEKQSLEKQDESLKQKLDKLKETNTEFVKKESGWRLRERHFQQKIEKDTSKAKQTAGKYQNMIRQHESTISEYSLNLDSMKNEERELRKRINDQDMAQIRSKQRQERLKKDVKFSQQKVSSLEYQLKSKIAEIQSQIQKNRQLESKSMDKDQQFSRLKQQSVHQQNKNLKQQQIIQILKKDISKLNHFTTQLQNTIAIKEQSEDNLRNEIKISREEVTKEKIRGNRVEGEFEKFKDAIHDIIRIQFVRILNTPRNTHRIAEKLRESQSSNARSEKSQKSRVKGILDAGQLTATLSSKLHETKTNLWKMVELNKVFKLQNSKIMEKYQSASNKHQFARLQHHQDIQELEDEMNVVMDDKEVEVQNYDNLVIDLNAKIKEKEFFIEELRGEIQEYNAIVTGLRTDFETNNELNQKKVNSLRNNITELNQRIQYLNLNVACLEDKHHDLDERNIQNENQIILHKQLLIKNEKTLIDTKQNQSKLCKSLQSLKKQFKASQDTKQEIYIQLNTQKQMRQKYSSMLEEQQRKSQKLNEFISGLIVQKEAAIKQELERSQEVNSLQNKDFESNQTIQLLKEENQNLMKKNEQNKEQLKIVNKSIKNMEKQMSEEKKKNNRSSQKIRQRDTDIQIKKQYIKDLEAKYREVRDNYYKEIKQLSNQLQDKNSSSFSLNKQFSDKILKLQAENKKAWEQTVSLKGQFQHLNKEMHIKNDEVEDLRISIQKLEEQKLNLQAEITSKQFILHQRVSQIQKLQLIVEEQAMNVQHINDEFQTYQKQFDLNINEVTSDFNFRIQNLTTEYEQRLELAERENQFVSEKNTSLEEEFSKAVLGRKSQEIQSQQAKKHYEQKLKKMENERLANTLAKNTEIKKMSEENKSNLTRIHQKESENRKLCLENQQLKLATGRTQQYLSHSLEQSKNKEKLLGKQLQGWKSKQQISLNFKQTLLTSLYQNEVQVRKILALTTKKVMEGCDKSDAQKLRVVLKGMESNVINAMMARMES